MRSTQHLLVKTTPHLLDVSIKRSGPPSIVQIDNATFYRQYPSDGTQDKLWNPPIFPGLRWSLPSKPDSQQHWAVIGPSNAGKTTFLEILLGRHISIPPNARSFPFLSQARSKANDRPIHSLDRAIQYVGFDDQRSGSRISSARGAYMSARYESRREDTDYSVIDFLNGNTELNPGRKLEEVIPGQDDVDRVVEDLRLANLLRMPFGNLSNGQTRRARIAKALLGKPELLLLDEPFSERDLSNTEDLYM